SRITNHGKRASSAPLAGLSVGGGPRPAGQQTKGIPGVSALRAVFVERSPASPAGGREGGRFFPVFGLRDSGFGYAIPCVFSFCFAILPSSFDPNFFATSFRID